MKLIHMLPFLEDEEKKELVDSILNNEIDKEKLCTVTLLPFIEAEEVNRLFKAALEKKIDVNPASFLPFVKDSTINELIERINAGEDVGISVDTLIPFLESDQVKSIFKTALQDAKKKAE